MSKRAWVMLFFALVLLTLNTGASGTTFSCSGSGTGQCVGDVCD